MSLTKTSKFISKILRHHPEIVGITLDEHGWADVDELIEGINNTGRHNLTPELLDLIVAIDEKQRYSYSEDKRLIRANQGHSIPVDVELPVMTPPDVLYHGTASGYVASIEEKGLLPMGRLYVHLSKDTKTASSVGKRHRKDGQLVILKINCKQMVKDGYPFYLSVNEVWLTKEVPVKYLEQL